MRMQRDILFRMATIVATLIPLSSAFATSPFRFENRRENPGAFRLLPEVGSLSTSENYDYEGAKTTVSGLNSYKKTTFDLTGVYGINPKLSVFGRLSMSSVSFETTSLTGSGSGLSEQGMGVNYRLLNFDRATIDGQFQLDIPLYDNVSARTSTPRQPLRGDGTLDITFATFGTLPLSKGTGTRLFLLGGLGYTVRNNNYSAALPYQLQFVGIPEKTGILYRVGFHGFKSMTANTGGTGDFSPQSQTTPGTIDPQDAGRSLIVDALSSSYMQLRATLGYQWNPIGDQVYLTYLMPMSGVSTAAITGILVGAQFRWAGDSTPTSTSYSNTSNTESDTSTKVPLSYDIEARVKQVNDRLNLVKIDKGETDGIEKGDTVDVYRTNADGTPGDLVARGVVTSVNETEAAVNLRQYKKEVWVQAGFIARRVKPQNR